MVLVPHRALILRTLRRVFPFACFFLCLNLLHDKSKREVRLRGDGGRPWDWETREAGEKRASQPSSVGLFDKAGKTPPTLALPHPLPRQSSNTLSSHIAQPETATPITCHQKCVEEVRPLWMRVTDDLYIYSAFWDARKDLPMGPVVRVLGLLRYQKDLLHDVTYQWSGEIRKDALNYSCYLWYTGQDAEKGELSAFIYEEGLKVFVGTYFFCSPQLINNSSSPKSSDSRVPYAVSLVPNGANNTLHKLLYLSPNQESEQGNADSSGVCVRALFGPYSDLPAITLFISYYHTVLKISHFYFYEIAISKTVREFLMLLMAEGEVSIHLLPWNIPFSELDMLWDLGSLTSTNDCIYRTSGRHNHVAIVDLDEFIVPRAAVSTLGQLYTSVIQHKHGQEGDAVLILNAFFCSEFQNKGSSRDDFNVFKATYREARLWPSKSRSKLIVVPQAVVSVGHHMVHSFVNPALKNQASPKLLSVLHHYRTCEGLRTGVHAKGSLVVKQKPVRDNAILKYKKDVLASRIVSQYLRFTKKTL